MNDVAAFLHPTTIEQLAEVYTIDHSQVGPALSGVDNKLKKIKKLDIIKMGLDAHKLMYFVGLYISVDEPILEKDLERWLWDNKQLLGRPEERGRVAFRVNFFVREKFRSARLATYLCGKEESYFRTWGAKEIQVAAQYIGRWVWTRPRFGYQITDFDFRSMQQKYKEWQRANGILPVARAARLSDFPSEFLLSDEVGSLPLYKAL
jgi:hypothetical protein